MSLRRCIKLRQGENRKALRVGKVEPETTQITNPSVWVVVLRYILKSLTIGKKLLQPMSTYKIDVPAGPIWSQDEAPAKANAIAAAHRGKWTGQWNTVVEGEMSVVELELPVTKSGSNEFKTDVLAGPLWSNDEAQKIGSVIAASYGAEFTGQCKTIVEGVMSVIEIKYTF